MTDNFGYTPLDLAVKYNEESIVKMIKEALKKVKVEIFKKNN